MIAFHKSLLLVASSAMFVSCFSEHVDEPTEALVDNTVPINEDERFTKRDRSHAVEEVDVLEELRSYDLSGLLWGRVAIKQGRPHMVPNAAQTQFVLYKDETFVLDLGYLTHNVQTVEANDVQVLANFEPVDFHWVEVEENDEYPSLEFLEELGEDSLRKSQRFVVPNDVPKRFTIAIPPESLGEVGAYDIRVLVTHFHRTDTGLNIQKYGNIDLSFSVTLFFGGTNFNAQIPSLEDPSIRLVTRPLMGSIVPKTSVLAPAEEIPRDMTETYTGPLELTAWFFAPQFSTETEPVATAFVRDGMVHSDFRLASAPPKPSRSFEGLEIPGRRLAVEGEESGRFTFVTFRRPFQDQGDVAFNDSLISLSNTLIVESE